MLLIFMMPKFCVGKQNNLDLVTTFDNFSHMGSLHQMCCNTAASDVQVTTAPETGIVEGSAAEEEGEHCKRTPHGEHQVSLDC